MQVVEAPRRPMPEAAPAGEEPEVSPESRRRISTTIDDIEAEFQRKKKKELEEARMAGGGDGQPVQQRRNTGNKVGRNDPCPCGSGKKFKKCCGVAA
jgi:preprotein translocase subunit SecA